MHLLRVAIGVRWHNNNNKLFIMYLIGHLTLVLTDSTHLIYRLWWTPDTWFVLDLTYTLLCVIHITVYLLIHVVSYSSLYYYHMFALSACASFQFILTYSLGVLTPWICISRSVAIYYWSGIWRGSHASWEARVPLSWLLVFLLFCSCHFLILSKSHLVVISFLYSSAIIVLDIYMLYCSDIDLS